ncbi:unnamed protein product [Camellia sinensis]
MQSPYSLVLHTAGLCRVLYVTVCWLEARNLLVVSDSIKNSTSSPPSAKHSAIVELQPPDIIESLFLADEKWKKTIKTRTKEKWRWYGVIFISVFICLWGFFS